MEAPRFERLRTAVMVAGMTVLPLIAVVGLRLPWETPGTKVAGRAVAAGPTGTAEAAAADRRSGPEYPASFTKPAEAKSSNVPNSPIQLTANHDVRAMAESASPPARFVSSETIYPLPSPTIEEPASGPTAADAADRFSQIQQRLRALGATHYALETWGPNSDLYRFQCRMAAGHQPGYSRQFEATDVDALHVMQTVLEDVEAWKAGRLP